MKAITNTQQLNTFDVIKTILKGGTEINKRFRDSDFYEFEPNLMAINFSQVPYIVIETPTTPETDLLVFDHNTTLKSFEVNILLVMGYEARSKFRTYANEIIRQIESNESTLESYGYYDPKIMLEDVGVEMLDRRQVVVGRFILSLDSKVER